MALAGASAACHGRSVTGRLDTAALHHLLGRLQSGVVARRQLIELGADDNDIERMLRRRELTAVLPGVYADHTGRLSRRQLEWCAVLGHWPAALTRESALRNRPLDVVQIAVALDRHLVGTERIWIHRTPDFTQRVNWREAPPAIELEHATIDVMSTLVGEDAIDRGFTVLADVCQTRRTTPGKVAATLAGRCRVPGRATIAAMIADLADGSCSVLERGYVHRVERPHGLPRPRRQKVSAATGRRSEQDIHYAKYGVVIELDGRAFHDNAFSRDKDARRDLAELAAKGDLTTRLTYGLVFRDSCWTAAAVGALLRRRGWTGPFVRCPACPRNLITP